MQAFANAFILDDVKVKAYMRMKVLVHEEKNQENYWEQNVIVNNKVNHK